MKKSYKITALCIIIAALIFVGAITVYKSTQEKEIVYPEDAITVEAEIIDVLFLDEDDISNKVCLNVIQDGKQDKDQIWLQKDTAILDKNGKKLEFLDLKKGQSIRATTCPDVLYGNPLVASGSAVDGYISNKYFRCYDVTILVAK